MKKLLLIICLGLYAQIGYAMDHEQKKIGTSFVEMKKNLQDKINTDSKQLEDFEKDFLADTKKSSQKTLDGQRLILLARGRISVSKAAFELTCENEKRVQTGQPCQLDAGLMVRHYIQQAAEDIFLEELQNNHSDK